VPVSAILNAITIQSIKQKNGNPTKKIFDGVFTRWTLHRHGAACLRRFRTGAGHLRRMVVHFTPKSCSHTINAITSYSLCDLLFFLVFRVLS